ncbi:phage virion morphogenesis protein [Inhella inkyongensis]|uniref:Phage virion morphogenesis protein n=1 Tax=Inhella inkyongensis TaxID=392593 RepID=A0A840S7M7_9BURK|nr:phage virion morphogenesis protein [Inhella inkyongensis]MBB5204450.1 phage virion morphogenesis protein [Inhella inkyongensis]
MIRISSTQPSPNPLEQLLKRLADVRPAMEAIGAEMESRVANRFETRTDPSGSSWAPWAPSTAAAYPKNGRGQLLERHGDMLSSLSWQADSTSVLIGFGAAASHKGDVYAIYHEFGTAHMPRRGLLTADPDAGTLAPDDVAAIDQLLRDHFLG